MDNRKLAERAKKIVGGIGATVLVALASMTKYAEEAGARREREEGVTRTIDGLIDTNAKDEDICCILNKHWSVPREKAIGHIAWVRSCYRPRRILVEHLRSLDCQPAQIDSIVGEFNRAYERNEHDLLKQKPAKLAEELAKRAEARRAQLVERAGGNQVEGGLEAAFA